MRDTLAVVGCIACAVLCLGAFVALAIVAVGRLREMLAAAAQRERERLEALSRWARQHRWQLVERPRVEWVRRLPGRDDEGVSRALFGTIDGRPAVIAEYSYTTSSTTTDSSGRTSTSTSTHRHVVLVLRLRVPFPTVAVSRRNGLSKFWRSLFGDRSIAIGYQPFDDAFHLTADDPRLVRAVLGRHIVAAHLSGQLPDWSVEGTELMTDIQGRIADPDGIPAQFGPLLRVAGLLEAQAGRER